MLEPGSPADPRIARAAGEKLRDLLAPPRCLLCGGAVAGGRGALARELCSEHALRLSSAPPLIDSGPDGVDLAVAAGVHDGALRELVLALKYARLLSARRVAAELIANAAPAFRLRGSLVPVPASSWRWRSRGFDPAEEIAIALAERTGLAYGSILRRSSAGRQVGRSRSERLSGAPRISVAPPVPRRVIVVDDVRTTGATLSACACALRDAGASEVIALTLSRA